MANKYMKRCSMLLVIREMQMLSPEPMLLSTSEFFLSLSEYFKAFLTSRLAD